MNFGSSGWKLRNQDNKIYQCSCLETRKTTVGLHDGKRRNMRMQIALGLLLNFLGFNTPQKATYRRVHKVGESAQPHYCKSSTSSMQF
jgi:hypothetical protein